MNFADKKTYYELLLEDFTKNWDALWLGGRDSVQAAVDTVLGSLPGGIEIEAELNTLKSQFVDKVFAGIGGGVDAAFAATDPNEGLDNASAVNVIVGFRWDSGDSAYI